jgi:hypothetical protein
LSGRNYKKIKGGFEIPLWENDCMKTTMNKKLAMLCFLLISINYGILWARSRSNAGTEPNRPVTTTRGRIVVSYTVSDTKGIKPVAHKELLNIFEQAEKQNTEELNNRFEQFPKKQKLEAIAYCLKEGEHLGQAVRRIVWDPNSRDKCLASYLAEAMPKMERQDLMFAARAAGMIPDVNLMEPLLNYTIESDYYEVDFGLGTRSEYSRRSVFDYAANAISKITNGKIGNIDQKKSQQTLVQEWRDAWPRVQEEMQKVINPVAHKELLDLLAKAEAEGLEKRDEFANKFKTYKWTEKLETIAYALEQGLYPNSISYYMLYQEKDMQDKRLIPFIDRAIKKSKGEILLAAVRITAANPDSSLLPSLMKYALENDYVKEFKYGTEKNQVEYLSVFGYASGAIYRITNGKIGSLNYSSTRKEIPEAEKKDLIEKWRKIYDETLKKDYEKN